MKDEYTILTKNLDTLRRKYPKILKNYVEIGREYRREYNKQLLAIFSQYASQPLRDAAVQGAMDLLPITDKWQQAEYEYNLWKEENWILNTMSKLLMASKYAND